MTASSAEEASGALAARVRDPGYTPGIRDLPGLLALFAIDDEELTRVTERAVLRIEMRHAARLVSEIVAGAEAAVRPARGRLTRLVGRVASAAAAVATPAAEAATRAARTWLAGALSDGDPKTRHLAARALGKLRPAGEEERATLEHALLDAWDAAQNDEDRRALAEALGKVGSKAARDRLSGAGSPQLEGRLTRAALMIDRTTARENPGAIDLTRAPGDGDPAAARGAGSALAVRFHSRSGLEKVVSSELGEAWRPRIAGSGLVDARLEGPLAAAVAIRTALYIGFPLEPIPLRESSARLDLVASAASAPAPDEELAQAVVRAILHPRSLAVLRAFTRTDGGPIRFRLAWTRGGHRRALAWRCAELIAAATKELVNDPTASTWEIVVDDHRDRVAIELVPRGFADERFAYREAAVPASSHPTIAAALARLVPPRSDDVVWDPFVGAGAELVERARLGPYASLAGTDIESAAIDAARKNVAAAGLADVMLSVGDATRFEPAGPKPSLIITNPPMGRRVQRGTHADVLERFVDHAAKVLAPGGALVWAVPDARRLHERAERAGLTLEHAFTVDMGGFPAELSVHRKRGA